MLGEVSLSQRTYVDPYKNIKHVTMASSPLVTYRNKPNQVSQRGRDRDKENERERENKIESEIERECDRDRERKRERHREEEAKRHKDRSIQYWKMTQ